MCHFHELAEYEALRESLEENEEADLETVEEEPDRPLAPGADD